MSVAARRGRQDPAHVLRRAHRPRSGGGDPHHASAAHRSRDAHLRSPQPAHVLGGAHQDEPCVPALHGDHRRADRRQHAADACGRAERVSYGRGSRGPRLRRRRAGRRQGRCAHGARADHRHDSGRRADRQHPGREAQHHPGRRDDTRHLHRAGPADRRHQQRDGAVPAGAASARLDRQTVSGRPELLSIIVPIYNEAATLRAIIDRLLAVDLPLPREILVVNDGSTDGTREVLDAAGRERLPIVVLHVYPNAGKGSAVRHALQHARGSIVAVQDADLELDPGQLASLVEPIRRGAADVVYGSRFVRGRGSAPRLTYVGNRVLTSVTNLLFGASLTDMETCYKVMRADVARSLELTAERFDIEPEITARLLRLGYQIYEVAVRYDARSRRQGKKIRWRDGVRALQVLLRERLR
ncbi:MAG: glycosyltransferase family 2 protein [Acidobacteria bacterium]|nr:glycosyltransferase family 2 protein [Acidobacteriota bacterium]